MVRTTQHVVIQIGSFPDKKLSDCFYFETGSTYIRRKLVVSNKQLDSSGDKLNQWNNETYVKKILWF